MFYKVSLDCVNLIILMSIFTSKKVWQFLVKTQLSKSDPKKTKGWKLPSLMPIKVNIGTLILPGDGGVGIPKAVRALAWALAIAEANWSAVIGAASPNP